MRVIRHIVEHQNSGATIVLEVDKETKGVFMYLSVCTKDNFSRKKGVEIATSRDPVLFFKLKSLDNFKDRALKAVANECCRDDYENLWGPCAWEFKQVELLRQFLVGSTNGKTEF